MQPINLTPGTSEAVAAFFETQDPGSGPTLERLARLVEGFETPYSLELLATVHYAAEQDPPTVQLDELIPRVRSWSGRKARLFTPAHVTTAYHRLQDAGLLPVASMA